MVGNQLWAWERTRHRIAAARILTATPLIKCGMLLGNLRVVGLFSTYFTKKPSISSWLTTQGGVGDKLGFTTGWLSLFFTSLPAFQHLLSLLFSSVYHLEVEAGQLGPKTRWELVTKNIFFFFIYLIIFFKSKLWFCDSSLGMFSESVV